MNHSPTPRRRLRLVLVAALSGAVFLGQIPAAQAQQAVSIVEPDPGNAGTWKFDPADVTVKPGTTVTWTHKGKQQHSVSSDDGKFDSGILAPGQSWGHKFDAPGDYPYTCTPHPYMTGIVRVK